MPGGVRLFTRPMAGICQGPESASFFQKRFLPDCHTALRRVSTDVRRRKAPDLRKEIACPEGRKGVYTIETMMNEAVLELDTLELEKICGGNEELMYQYAEELARYMDMLVEKYNCYGRSPRYLNKLLTPEERARIRELRNKVYENLD